MPPRKPTSRALLGAQGSAVLGGQYERRPVAPPALPDPTSVAPLWATTSLPAAVFPEWPDAAGLAVESWHTEDAPFEDSTPLSCFAVPWTWEKAEDGGAAADATEDSESVTWKRPREFLPAIVETPPTTAAAPPEAAAKNAKKPPPAATATGPKKGEPIETQKKPARYAHVLYIPPSVDDHHHPTTTPPTAAETKKGAPSVATAAGTSSSSSVHPVTPAVLHPPPRQLVRDFQRRWSPEQREELAAWWKEEARMAREREARERVYMEFEDAIGFIINERPRRALHEVEVNEEDLIDDGDDGDLDGPVVDESSSPEETGSHDSSPFGVLPPPRIDIAPNAVIKPEIPHGDVVHADLVSYFRLVDELHRQWAAGPSSPSKSPYLWESIYPQDPRGVPVYNPGGKYLVRLFVMGKWRRIDVDDRLPVDRHGHIHLASSAMRNELWPSLLAKALLKVAHWLRGAGAQTMAGAMSESDAAIAAAATAISALTSWKITTLDMATTAASAPDTGHAHPLRPFVPEEPETDTQNELILDAEGDAPEVPSPAPSEAHSRAPPHHKTPRAVLCCTTTECSQGLHQREVALVTGIVEDSDNVVYRLIHLNGSLNYPEEDRIVGHSAVILVHPEFKHSDLVMETWKTSTEGIVTPFPDPPLCFCVIKVPRQSEEDEEHRGVTVDVTRQSHIDVVVTLTRCPPELDVSSEADISAAAMAAHLGVDALGSVILVEDTRVEAYRQRQRRARAEETEPSHQRRRPLTFKIGTVTSALLRIPIHHDQTDIVFRVYTQPTCQYGYSLQVESEAPVDLQRVNTCWRNVWDLQVIEGDGSYPVLLPNTWNVLFKQSLELAPGSQETSPELYLDLHLGDAQVATFTQMTIIDNNTNHCTIFPGLHSHVLMPIPKESMEPRPLLYTVIVECFPRSQVVPEGKWHLIVGSNLSFKHASIHQPRQTLFSGQYEPNKSLTFFRDIITNPKKTSSISLELQIDQVAEGRTEDHLAIKLEVIDRASERVLRTEEGGARLRLLQLPPYDRATDDPNEEKSGYIIQGSIDRSHCDVPSTLESVRPFRNPNEVKTEAQALAPSESTAKLEFSTRPITWRLTCWSTDEVKLEFDRAKELRFEAIRAGWAEASKDRNAHGLSSRLMFLGKMESAETAMRDDGLSDDVISRYKNRHEWLTTSLSLINDGDYIEQLPESDPAREIIRSVESFVEEEAAIQQLLDRSKASYHEQKETRTAAKETRAQELKEFIQSVKDRRGDAAKQRQALHAQRDEIREQIRHLRTAAMAP